MPDDLIYDTSGNMKRISHLKFSHDKLFKEIWSDVESARSFLENYLPSALLAVMDLTSLEIHKGSFVEKNLKEYHLETLLRYLIANIEDMSSEKLKSIVEGSMSEKEGETVMTFANTMLGKSFYQGVEQGMQQGMQQGILQELKEAVMDLMDIRYGTMAETEHAKQLINTMENIDRLKALKHKIKSGASIAEITATMGN